MGQIKFVAAVIILTVLFGVVAAEAKTKEGTRPDFFSCDVVINEQRYDREQTMRTMHAFDLDDEKDIHNFIRTCELENRKRGYWDLYMANQNYYRSLVDALLEWREDNGLQEFDDTTEGKIVEFLFSL